MELQKQLTLNEVYHMDVLEGLRLLPSNFAHIIVADPPYNMGKDFGVIKENWELEEYIEWSMEWINEALRILRDDGTMFIFGLSEVLAYIFVRIKANKRWIIWHYTNKNVPTINFWQRSHESIIVVWKREYIFNRDNIREPYTDNFLRVAGKIRKSTPGRFSKGDKETIYVAHEKGALPRDVIKVPALAGGAGSKERWFYCRTCKNVYPPYKRKDHREHDIVVHPTQKPLGLMEKLILSARPKEKDGIVVVPFVGSGTECVVSVKHGLKFIGFEINPEYILIARKRIEEVLKSESGRLFKNF